MKQTTSDRKKYYIRIPTFGRSEYIPVSEFYGDGFGNIVDRFKYKGRGRPRKTDYIGLNGAQRQVNTILNNYLDNIKI